MPRVPSECYAVGQVVELCLDKTKRLSVSTRDNDTLSQLFTAEYTYILSRLEERT